MTSLRILIVLTDPPLPFGNAAARWYYVLCKGLVERGHRVTVFAAYSKPEELEQACKLFPAPQYDMRYYTHQMRTGLRGKLETLRRPYSYLFSPELQRDLDAEIERGCDILHLEHIWTGWLGLKHTQRTLLTVLYVFGIDLADTNSPTFAGRLRQRLSLRAEKSLLRHYPVISTLTPRLTDFVRAINPAASVQTVPLGLDFSLYPFAVEQPSQTPPVVSLIGSFSWGPTHSAGVRLLTRLWPEIKRRLPQAQLQIVGREARKAMEPFIGGADIAIHENVPDTLPYFRRASVLLYAPSRGSGMKVKVMEAMALGVPVVTTSEGVEGLPAEDGIHAGVCEDDEGLIARTVALLNNPAQQHRQRHAARALIERHCGPEPTLAAVEEVYRSILPKTF
ncbi:MAG: glycosyltransferase family 4 protein [Acidobacteriota bacterium]